jgi:hypothetical protein
MNIIEALIFVAIGFVLNEWTFTKPRYKRNKK